MIAKIEKAEAVDALDDDRSPRPTRSMVARGDLGVEIGPADGAAAPEADHPALRSSRGEPVITATQMLESMIQQRRADSRRGERRRERDPRRHLGGDAAPARRRSASYPVEAVEVMDRIARAVEPHLGYRHELPEAADNPTIGQAMSNAACDLAEALGAKAILVPTFTARTASAVARLRPRRPILGLTHHRYALQQMAIEWGVTPLADPRGERRRRSLGARRSTAARESGLVEPGDRVVLTAGTAVNMPGTTNVIKVEIA